MRKSILKISSFFLILGLSSISIIGISQETKLPKKERKDARKAEMFKSYQGLGVSLEMKRFVLEMDYQTNQNQNKTRLNPMSNFIMVDTSSCVFQNESTNIISDLDKVVSKVEGSIDGWKLAKDIKHLSYYLQFRMFTDNGLYYVSMSINYDKSVSGSLTSKGTVFGFYGRIVMP
jgi:hypothetical protein